MHFTEKRMPLLATGVAVLAALAVGFFVAFGVRSVVADPDSAPSAALTNPGHAYNQIELPIGTWPLLDADLLDGAEASALEESTEIDADIVTHTSNASAHHTKTTDASRLGFSRTSVDTAGDVGRWVSATVGADGLPFVTYYGGGLKVVHCGNAACSSGNTVSTVDGGADVDWATSVTVGADGLPFISYTDFTDRDLKVVHCGNVSCSAGNSLTTVDSIGWVGLDSSVTIGADGLPVISYYDDTNSYLKVAHCGNASCSAGNTITTVDTGSVGQETSITIGADGLPVISYEGGGLKVVHCGNSACSSGNTISAVGGGAGHTSIAVGTDGLPIISYGRASSLEVAHCGNLACSSGNTVTVVDSAGDTGHNSSLTMGADGMAVISYFDNTNGDLKVAHCGNAACSTLNTTVVVDTNLSNFPTSMVVAANGMPVISYYDVVNGDLKVAHCSNHFCVPYHRTR